MPISDTASNNNSVKSQKPTDTRSVQSKPASIKSSLKSQNVGLPPRRQSGKRIVINDKPQSVSEKPAFVTDPKVQKLLKMKPGEKSESSLESADLQVSGDEQLLSDLNGSLSSSEFDQEIREKVKKHLQAPSQFLGQAGSDLDSDLEDVDLNTAFDFYDIMTPQQKLLTIKARADKLRKKQDKLTERLNKLAEYESSDYDDEIDKNQESTSATEKE